jgi:hypothetical protein
MSRTNSRPTSRTREALAIYGLRKRVVHYGSQLHETIHAAAEAGHLDDSWAEALHMYVGNFEANLGEGVTFDGLVNEGHGDRCHDCDTDTQPCDDDGSPLAGAWERYMVKTDVWEAATKTENSQYLCIGCLESRLGRRLC